MIENTIAQHEKLIKILEMKLEVRRRIEENERMLWNYNHTSDNYSNVRLWNTRDSIQTKINYHKFLAARLSAYYTSQLLKLINHQLKAAA
jgi:hypothetical protein